MMLHIWVCPVFGEFSVAQCFTYVSDNFWQVQHAITLPFYGPAFGEFNKPSSSPIINKGKMSKLNTKEKTYSSENMRVCFLSTFETSFYDSNCLHGTACMVTKIKYVHHF